MIKPDLRDLLFRLLFAFIFVCLGVEHLFSDHLLQELMPRWVPFPRGVSILCGLWLLFWGLAIVVGWRIQRAGVALGVFVLGATVFVHIPGMVVPPLSVPGGCEHLWDILQRSNFAKNLCLLGVCVALLDYRVGAYSWDRRPGCNRLEPVMGPPDPREDI